jgi:hypothetical protein
MLSNINEQTIAMLLPDAARAGRGARGIRQIALITADRYRHRACNSGYRSPSRKAARASPNTTSRT